MIVTLLLGLAGCAGPGATPRPVAAPLPAASPDSAIPEIVTLMPPDAIRAIDEPLFLSAGKADRVLSDDEQVIGLVVEGDARAYPLAVLTRHEIVNDTVGGLPVAVTYCATCGVGVVFQRTLGEQVLRFGVSGKLVANALVMFDRETNSLWSQVFGRAIAGPLEGERLELVSANQHSWAEWRLLHPVTRVLDDGTRSGRPAPAFDPAALLQEAPGAGTGSGYVLGVAIEGETRAYPLEALRQTRVLNDRLAGRPLVVAIEPESGAAAAWDPRVGERPLTFTPAPDDSAVMLDAETGSRWSVVEGRALAGPLAGRRLNRIPSDYSHRLGWLDRYPTTDFFHPPSDPGAE